MAYTKKAVNAKYDKLRAQLKKGTISKSAFKAAANRLYNLYHSDSNKATRNKVKIAPKPTKKPKTKAKPDCSSNFYSSSSQYTGNNLKGKTNPDAKSNFYSSSSQYTGNNLKRYSGPPPTNSNFMSSSSKYTGNNLKNKKRRGGR